MFLSSRQLDTPFSYSRMVAIRETLDKILGISFSTGFHDLIVGGILIAHFDVLIEGAVEENGLLEGFCLREEESRPHLADYPDLFSETVNIEIFDVYPVD